MAQFSQAPGQPGSVIVTPHGDLDIVAGEALHACLDSAQRDHGYVIIDLSAVPYMDSSALAVIIQHWKKAQAAGGALLLVAPQKRPHRLLSLTGMTERLPIYATVAEATTALPSVNSG